VSVGIGQEYGVRVRVSVYRPIDFLRFVLESTFNTRIQHLSLVGCLELVPVEGPIQVEPGEKISCGYFGDAEKWIGMCVACYDDANYQGRHGEVRNVEK